MAALNLAHSGDYDFLDNLSASPEAASNAWHKLLGSWRLVTWEEHDEADNVNYPLGEDAVGQLFYDRSGKMSVQLMQRDPLPFRSEDWRQAAFQEKASAWGGYFAYFGTFLVDENEQVVIHHIEGSWFPNLVGSNQIRHYRFEGTQLVLLADTAWGRVRVVWERMDGYEH